MPDFHLSQEEAEHLAAYLMRGETPNMEPLPDRGLMERGKEAFERYQCGQCHSRVEEASSSGPTPSAPLSKQSIRRLPGERTSSPSAKV